jgi:hypothetical protein
MSAGEDVSLEGRLETIEKRLGRLEQLINVVLEKHEKSALRIERRIESALEKVRSKETLRMPKQGFWTGSSDKPNRQTLHPIARAKAFACSTSLRAKTTEFASSHTITQSMP